MRPLHFKNDHLILLDQTKLPTEVIWVKCVTWEQVADAIKTMVVRGAPAIGVTAAYGVAIGSRSVETLDKLEYLQKMSQICESLKNTRPTAVNLFWAIEHMQKILSESSSLPNKAIGALLLNEAIRIDQEDTQANRAIGSHGSKLIKEGNNILTHCNAGALATSDYGTALGVMYSAHEEGKKIHVYADETRPWLQGARLTAWELMQSGIAVTLICDNMAGSLMQQGKVDLVITGADRIASNGDTANKIGTYSVAVLANYHHIPFYIAAPLSTIDTKIKSGKEIPIEERSGREITHIKDIQLAPEGITVFNPAFDVTPAGLIAGIITERGILTPPYEKSIQEILLKKGIVPIQHE